MDFKKLLLIVLLAFPLTSSAAFAVPWNATSTTQGWISPNRVGSVNPTVVFENLKATSTTATSTFNYDIQVSNGVFHIDKGNETVIIGNVTGDTRGAGAIDIQTFRTAVDQVASGILSVAYGIGNKAGAVGSIALGLLNSVTSNQALGVGYSNTIGGTNSSGVGSLNVTSNDRASAVGYNNNISGFYSSAFGNDITNTTNYSTQVGPSDAAKLTILGDTNTVGFVGIGTSTPYSQLTVWGKSTATSSSVFELVDSASTTLVKVFNSGQVRVGLGSLFQSTLLHLGSTTNSFLQANIQNLSNGDSASSDFVATNDIGTDSTYYIDMGINSSGYNNSNYTITGANDAYLYAQSNALSIGTATSSALGVLKFHTGGTLAANERMRITSAGSVGIGSTSPYAKLSVSTWNLDITTIAGVIPQFAVSSSTGSSATSTDFIVDKFGNVGVGTSSPFARFSSNTSAGKSSLAIGSSTTFLEIDQYGHHITDSFNRPVVSGCGTNARLVEGNDKAGKIAIGGGASVTACTLTFSNPYALSPVCVSNFATSAARSLTSSTTASTIDFASSASFAGLWFNYICEGVRN